MNSCEAKPSLTGARLWVTAARSQVTGHLGRHAPSAHPRDPAHLSSTEKLVSSFEFWNNDPKSMARLETVHVATRATSLGLCHVTLGRGAGTPAEGSGEGSPAQAQGHRGWLRPQLCQLAPGGPGTLLFSELSFPQLQSLNNAVNDTEA